MRERRIFLTDEQRQELVGIYIKSGFKGVQKRADELGVTTKYVTNLASYMGLHRERIPGRAQQTENDPRWEWAKQRGGVIA